MTKKYVEVTIALDDANPDVLEVYSREKEDEGEWNISIPEPGDCAPIFSMYFAWLQLEIKKI